MFFRFLMVASGLIFANYSISQQKISRDTLIAQFRYAAKEELLDKYYPRNIDTADGGYISTYSFDFQPVGRQDKMIVTQARHTWSTARASMFYHDSSYTSMSRHGFHFLRDNMWDKQYGGFFTLVTKDGTPKEFEKQAYGNAFGIYALSAYYECSHDQEALQLAQKAFRWLEDHSHDKQYKGYFQNLHRDGSPITRTAGMPLNSSIGYKDQNSSIHILEALTELYKVWPDHLVKQRLKEMLLLIRDTMVTQRGNLQLFFTPAWAPITFRDSSEEVIKKTQVLDYVSFGHDVETAYLMQEASEALGNFELAKTRSTGKRMVDHALKNGWDSTLGGFYDEGYYYKSAPTITILKESKNWWAQAEGLNTLLILSEEYPDDPMHYYDRFLQLWQYVQTYLIDHEHGDWYEEGLDKEPWQKTRLKAQIWKGTYHNFRALSNCITRLEKMK